MTGGEDTRVATVEEVACGQRVERGEERKARRRSKGKRRGNRYLFNQFDDEYFLSNSRGLSGVFCVCVLLFNAMMNNFSQH